MAFSTDPLPYGFGSLAPSISERTLVIHYGKHHQGYLRKLNAMTEGKPEARRSLEDLIESAEGDLYNNAAQVWNHNFYWKSMKPGGGGRPEGMLLDVIENAFGAFTDFKQELAEAANGEFGSGWAWLVRDRYGRLRIQKSSDAENPIRHGFEPLLTIDVWEHAYYLDYQNERGRYVERFIDDLIDWDRVASRLQLPSAEEIAGWEEEERRREEERWGLRRGDSDG